MTLSNAPMSDNASYGGINDQSVLVLIPLFVSLLVVG